MLHQQRSQFPELVPTAVGSEWAGVTSGRVLNAKHSTATRSSAQSSRQLWDRVARAAGSTASVQPSSSSAPRPPGAAPATAAFPPLQSSGAGPSSGAAPPFRQQAQRLTPWAAASAAASPGPPPAARAPASVPGPGARGGGRPAPAPALSKSAFPELPTAGGPRVPRAAVGGNQSLRNILGESAPAQPAWQNGGDAKDAGGSGTPANGRGDGESASGGGKKKGKGKQKQTLFTLGSFPA